ncbi:antitoxin Xre/MbcA/ParS toxin-binding domain-containing protein [Ramlibacter sp.]|uniref:antitoxin Xre/MbcA/ParS toxin-binding domain-containing protein n=1 Tax=Ramlibacter sp. TaxID=1917967 RepID=UPI003D109504
MMSIPKQVQSPAPGPVLTKAALRASELLGLSHAALARVVGLSESQISRFASGEKSLEVGTKPAEMAALLVRVYRSLDALVGNDEKQRRAWMTGFNRAFNETPREAVQRVEGLVRVVGYLDAARAPI